MQIIKDILIDCDDDTVVFKVNEIGDAACHTGHRTCFFRKITGDVLETVGQPLFDPEKVYSK